MKELTLWDKLVRFVQTWWHIATVCRFKKCKNNCSKYAKAIETDHESWLECENGYLVNSYSYICDKKSVDDLYELV